MRPPINSGFGKDGTGKDGKGKSKRSDYAGKPTWVTEATINGKKIQLCMMYRSNTCQPGEQCPFGHYWKISKRKLLPFDSLCTVLGVQIDLRLSGDRLCFVSNADERVEELTREVDDIPAAKVLTRSDGERVTGRLQFASPQIFGRSFSPVKPCSPGQEGFV